jgi:hypothetical protein
MEMQKKFTRYKIHRKSIEQKRVSVKVLLLVILEAFIPLDMTVLLSKKPSYNLT